MKQLETNKMNTLTPNFSAAYQERNLKAIKNRKGVEIVEVNDDVKLIDSDGKIYYAGKSATVKVGAKKAIIYLSLTPFVIENVIGRMMTCSRSPTAAKPNVVRCN